MARGTKAPAFAKLLKLVVNYSEVHVLKSLIIVHEFSNTLDKRKGKGQGRIKARLYVFALALF